jgi:hypothetical protein
MINTLVNRLKRRITPSLNLPTNELTWELLFKANVILLLPPFQQLSTANPTQCKQCYPLGR